MSYKLTFQPQSISNKNISFQNGAGDAIKFSYSGSFKERKVDFEEIPLSAIFKAKAEGGWNCIQTMNPAWKTGGIKIANQDQKRQELGLRLKHLYVDRNIYAINCTTFSQIIKIINFRCILSNYYFANLF